jgi:hypothetical protein
VLCCVVLCCVVLCCVVLCYVVLCCVVLCCGVLRCIVLSSQSCLVLSDRFCLFSPCLFCLVLVLSCLGLSGFVFSYLFVYCLVLHLDFLSLGLSSPLSCRVSLVSSWLVLSDLFLAFLVLSFLPCACFVLSGLVWHCLVLSFHVLSCPASGLAFPGLVLSVVRQRLLLFGSRLSLRLKYKPKGGLLLLFLSSCVPVFLCSCVLVYLCPTPSPCL